MGQRLVIVLTKDKIDIASCYYHWSGFTSYSISIINNVINQLKMFNGKEYYKVFKNLGCGKTNEKGSDRNEGIYDYETSEIIDSISWANQLVYIDVDNLKIDISKLFDIITREEYLMCYFISLIEFKNKLKIAKKIKNIRKYDIDKLNILYEDFKNDVDTFYKYKNKILTFIY